MGTRSLTGRVARSVGVLGVLVSCVLLPAQALAQGRAAVAASLRDLAAALDGFLGDEHRAASDALDRMRRALDEWDESIARLRTGIAVERQSLSEAEAARLRVSLGAALFERGRFDEAHRELLAASALDPTRSTPHLIRGLMHALGGEHATAARTFAQAAAAQPDDPIAAYFAVAAGTGTPPDPSDPHDASTAISALLAAYDRLGDRGAAPAAPFVHGALIADTATPQPLFLPAVLAGVLPLIAERRYTDAIQLIAARLPSDPLLSDPVLRLEETARGLAALRRGDSSAAVAALRAVVPQAPESSELRRVLATAYHQGRDHRAAVEQANVALELDPTNERAHRLLATMLLETSQFEAAESILQRAVQLLPSSGALHWLLAQTYATTGQDTKLLEAVQAASRIGALSGHGVLLSALGRLQMQRVAFEAAREAFSRTVALNPNSASAHIDWGDFLRSQNAHDEPLAEYVAAALIDPALAAAHARIGQLHVEWGRFAQAVAPLARALELDPGLEDARYALATALLRTGRTEEATAQLERFRQLQSKRTASTRRSFLVTILRTQADQHQDRGALEQAVALHERIVEEEPDVAANRVNLARLLVELGRHQAAIEHLRTARTLGGPPAVLQAAADLDARITRAAEAARRQAAAGERQTERAQVGSPP